MAVDQRRVRIGQQLTSFRPSRISPGNPSNADRMRRAPPSASLICTTLLRLRGTEKAREADLSTQQAGAQAASRLSCAHGDQGRPQGHQRAPRPRPQAPVRLIFMTPRLQRLRQRADFIATASGAKAHATGFVLQSRERRDLAPPRVGYTVSKKVGNAVERNRVRRRLREVVRLTGAQGMQAGRDYVVVGRRAALDLTFSRLIDDMSSALGRVHIAPHGQRRSGSRRDTK
jgi:ribonuclease P protein component